MGGGNVTITKEGNLVSFYTVNKAPIKHLKVYFSPKQAGEGTPSPENVREISGWSGLNTWHTNNNLLPLSDYSYRESGIAVSRTSKKISITGTSDGAFYRGVTGSWTADGSSVVLYNVPILTNGAAWYVWNGTGNIISGRNINGISFRPASGVKVSLCLAVDYANVTMNVEFTPIMCRTSDLSTIPIDWSSTIGTVYGGYVDLVTGELVETHAIKRVVGNEDWYMASGINGACAYRPTLLNVTSALDGNNYMLPVCNKLSGVTKWGTTINECTINNYGNFYFGAPEELSTSEAVNNWIQSIGGFEFTYPISPVTHQLTPIQLSTLIGRNNIWSNADRVEVEYDLAESNDELYRRRNILLRSAPHIETASGSIAHFETDIAAPIKGAKISFSPIQEGSGTPSPTNVKPISGFTNLSLYHSGENLYVPNSNNKGYISKSGVITVDETSTYTDLIPVNLGDVYSFECTTVSVNGDTNRRIHGYNSSGTWVKQLASGTTAANTVEDRKISATIPAGISYIRVSFRNQDTDVRITKENIVTTDWQTAAGTIYGGYIDLVSGELVQTYYYFTADADAYVAPYGSENYNGEYASNRAILLPYRSIITHPGSQLLYPVYGDAIDCNINNYNWFAPDINMWKCGINAGEQLHVSFSNSVTGYNPNIDTFAEGSNKIHNWLVENNLHFAIPLETSIRHQLSPTTLHSLRGINNIWSNANGSVEIKYWTH